MAGYIASYHTIPRDKKTAGKQFRFDYLGLVLLIIAIVTFIYGFSNANKLGWSSPVIDGSLAAFVIASIIFIIYENKISRPVVKLDLFKNRVFLS